MAVFPGAVPEGEQLLWTGRPQQGILFGNLHWVNMLCGLLPLVLGIYIGRSTAEFEEAWWRVSWAGVPFVLAGLYLIVFSHVAKAISRSSTMYAVTGRHVLVHRGFPSKRLAAVDLAQVLSVNLRPGKTGRGTIHLILQPHPGSGRRGELGPELEGIEDALGVTRLIEQGRLRALKA